MSGGAPYSLAARSGGLNRASTSGASSRREITRVLRFIALKYWDALRRTASAPSPALDATRAMLTRKRGSTPYSQAGMHLPLLVQTAAQRSASGVPGPPARRSRAPSTMARESAGFRPAGSTMGQATTHFPQRVQASSV